MRKIGLIIDSTSAISEDEAKKLGIFYIPTVISVNNSNYLSGVDINNEILYKKMNCSKVKLKTASPLGRSIEEAFDSALEKYPIAIFVGISHKFSSTSNAANLISKTKKYKGKIFVMTDTLFASPWSKFYLPELNEILEEYDNVEDVFELLRKSFKWQEGFLSPENISWFYKGGRITKSQYILANMLKIIPILTINEGRIDPRTTIKVRSFNKAVYKMCELIEPKVLELEKLKIPFKLITIKSNKIELLHKTNKIVKSYFSKTDKDVISTELSTEQTVHMGPNGFGLTVWVPLRGLK